MIIDLHNNGSAYHRGVNVDDPEHRVFRNVPTASLNWSQSISWGEPAEVTQTKADRRCGRCGAVRGEGYVTKSGTVVPGGLDLVFDRGDVFGARCLCNNCGFAF